MTILAIIQARVGSTRFPEKVLAPLAGIPLVTHVIRRVCATETPIRVCLAIPDTPENDRLAEIGKAEGVLVYRGHEHDVLARYWWASQLVPDADCIVRVTSDDPFKDPWLIDAAVNLYLTEWADQRPNILPPEYVWLGGPTWPLGCDVEVFSRKALDLMHTTVTAAAEREHVTLWGRRNLSPWVIRNPTGMGDYHARWTIDTVQDYAFAVKAYDALYADNPLFGFRELAAAGWLDKEGK